MVPQLINSTTIPQLPTPRSPARLHHLTRHDAFNLPLRNRFDSFANVTSIITTLATTAPCPSIYPPILPPRSRIHSLPRTPPTRPVAAACLAPPHVLPRRARRVPWSRAPRAGDGA
jgi:hypothetical protein